MTDKQREKAGSKSEHKTAKNAASASFFDTNQDASITGPFQDNSFASISSDAAKMGPHNFANPDHYEENLAQLDIRDIRNTAVEGIEKGSGERKNWADTLDESTRSDLETNRDTIYGKDNIEDYNFAMGGRGSLSGKEMISRADLKGLQRAGFSDEEIVEHVEKERADGAYFGGDRGQRFFEKMKNSLLTPSEEPNQTILPITQPEVGPEDNVSNPVDQIGGGNITGGGNNTGGGGNNTIGGGNNTIGGGGNNTGGNTDTNVGIDNSFNETIDQIQDVDIDQQNQQDFNVTQDNDLNVAITGDNNISDIQQDNSAANYGGNQSNDANVTGSSANTSSSNFLQNYLYGMGAFDSLRDAGIDVGGTLSSIGGNLSDTGTTTFTPDYPLTTTPGNTTSDQEVSDSYNTTYNQIQEIDSTQGNDQNFNVIQDNDLNAQITGDNNVSQFIQDNSVRSYGGDQRNFTYVSGSNANGTPSYLTDSPVSAATMAGYYSPSDSPASNAAFVDRYQTMNSDAQKEYNPFGTAEGYIARSTNIPGAVDTAALRQEINMAPELARARADMANLNAYGDQYKAPTVRWNSALGIFEPIEPYDPAKAAEEARNFFN